MSDAEAQARSMGIYDGTIVTEVGAEDAPYAVIIPTPDKDSQSAQRAANHARAGTEYEEDVRIVYVESSGPKFQYATSANAGLQRWGNAEYAILLNDDCHMTPGWLDHLRNATQRYPRVGIWGALLYYPDGSVQHAGGRIHTNAADYLTWATLHRNPHPFKALRTIRSAKNGEALSATHWTRPTPRLDFLTGALHFITRDCREAIGDYDTRYTYGWEDVDYCLKAREAGYHIGLSLNARGIHAATQTAGHLAQRLDETRVVFNQKWGRKIRDLTGYGIILEAL